MAPSTTTSTSAFTNAVAVAAARGNSPTSLLHWVKISTDHLQDPQEEEDEIDNHHHTERLVWWPCRLYKNYSDLYYGKDDDNNNLLHQPQAKNLIAQRIMDNVLRGKRFQIAQLLGRPLQDVVEVIDPKVVVVVAPRTATTTTTTTTTIVPNQQHHHHHHHPGSLYEHQTLDCQEFHLMTQEQWHSQLAVTTWNGNLDLYKSYVEALDLARRALQQQQQQGSNSGAAAATGDGGGANHNINNGPTFVELGQREWQAWLQLQQAHVVARHNGNNNNNQNNKKNPPVEKDESALGAARSVVAVKSPDVTAAAAKNSLMEEEKEDSEMPEVEIARAEATVNKENESSEDLRDEEEEAEHHEEKEVAENEAPETPQKSKDHVEDTACAAAASASSCSASVVTQDDSGNEKMQASSSSSSHSSNGSGSDADGEEADDHDHDEEEETTSLQIEPNDTFTTLLMKLQVDLGWDQIHYNGETVWFPYGKDPSSSSGSHYVQGKDYFNAKEIRDYFQEKYGWVDQTRSTRKQQQQHTTPLTKKPKASKMASATTSSRGGGGRGGSKKKTAPSSVTPSPGSRSQRSPRRKNRDNGESDKASSSSELTSPTPLTKKAKTVHHTFQSKDEETFYTFSYLMPKLTRFLKWGYKNGQFGGYEYIKPGHNGPRKGGKYMVDYFTEEHEVMEYCMKEKYYERRAELGFIV